MEKQEDYHEISWKQQFKIIKKKKEKQIPIKFALLFNKNEFSIQ